MKNKIKKLTDYFNAFLSWWVRELLSAIPAYLKNYFDERKNENWIEISTKGINVISFEENEKREAYFKGNGLEVLSDESFKEYLQGKIDGAISVKLSCNFVLERGYEIPVAAKNDFKNVIKFELPQLFPVEINKMYFDSILSDVRGDKDLIDVRIAMIKKTFAEKVITCLKDCGLSLNKLTSFPSKANGLAFSFLNLEAQYKKNNRRVVRGLIGATAFSLTILVWSVLNYYDNRAEFLYAEIKELSQTVSEVTKIKKEIDLYTKKEALHREAIEKVKFDQILEILTKSFPQDSWVFDYNQSADKVTVTGFSADTGELLTRLDEINFFKNISVSSNSVTNNQSDAVERFTFSMEIAKPSMLTGDEHRE